MDMIEVSAKTVNDAITEACQKLGVTSDKLDYEVVEEGSSGFLGIGAKPAVIKASVKKSSVEEVARVFLNDVFQAMNMEVVIDIKYNEEEKSMDIELSGNEMGVLIGKRGLTPRIIVSAEKKLLRILPKTLLIRLREPREAYLWSP